MSEEFVQAKYDELDQLAARFGQALNTTTQLRQKVMRSFEPLEKGGWQGRGAEAFTKEMRTTILPALDRMSKALEAGRSTTLQIKGVMQRAEEEAAKPFKGRGKAGALPDLVVPPAGAFDARRASQTIGPPQEVANHDFRSGKSAAIKYDVTIDGRTIPVYMPKTPSSTGNTHSIDEVAKALGALPPDARKLITKVDVHPAKNPDDAYWEKKLGRTGHESYMTAGANGVVDMYPTKHKQSQDFMDKSIHHEVGHTLSLQKWGNVGQDKVPDDPRWNDWKEAGKQDGSAASKYAQTATAEDFAETYALYHQVKGTPAEADARAQFPNRFQIIDDLVAGKR